MSNEHKAYLKKELHKKWFILISQISLLILFLTLWEVLSRNNVINSFIFSSPSKVFSTLLSLYENHNLFNHIFATSIEVIISFSLSTLFGFLIALLLYLFPTVKKILDPFITMLNSLPKVALGPLLIIWIGANQKSIIVMALLINLIVTFVTILNGFMKTDADKIKLFKVFGASRVDTITKLIIPSAKLEIISSLKLNISMSLIGVIMGEFLSCKEGVGYLILYGTQVFNLSLVMCGIFILLILSFIFYSFIVFIEKITS